MKHRNPNKSEVEVKLGDLATGVPVAAYSLTMMAAWLGRNGYR